MQKLPQMSVPGLFDGIDAVLFDMDGVLLDTEPLYTEATRRVLGDAADRYDFSIKERLMGRAPLESARILVETLGLDMTPSEYNDRKRPILLELFRSSRAMPGAPELVEHVFARGLGLAVATSSDRGYLAAKTSHHAFMQRFSAVVCGSDPEVARHKPAPDIFLEAARRIGVPPSRCLVFEDSPAGVTAARAAGAHRVVAIVDPRANRTLVAAADRVIGSYDELELG